MELPIIEQQFREYISDLQSWLPDGLICISSETLRTLNLSPESTPSRFFYVVDSIEKITLINEDYVVWIMPDTVEEAPLSCVLIAINRGEWLDLEMGFTTAGIYNDSKTVLQLLEAFLNEIDENELAIKSLINP